MNPQDSPTGRADPDGPIVTARDLTKSYQEKKVLTGLTFDLAEDRIHGLLGRNGTGKSTLLSILAGQVPFLAAQ